MTGTDVPPPLLDATTWDALVRFERKLKGSGGFVTIPTGDFRALMDAVRRFAVEIAAQAAEGVDDAD